MNWIMFVVAMVGTILLSTKQAKHRKVRLSAFVLWFFSNAYWAIFAGDPALQLQFSIYFLLAVFGIYNNIKEDKSEST